jgi:hypothetical protein
MSQYRVSRAFVDLCVCVHTHTCSHTHSHTHTLSLSHTLSLTHSLTQVGWSAKAATIALLLHGADSERCINFPSRASQTPYSLALDRQDVSILTILATHAAYLLRAGNVYIAIHIVCNSTGTCQCVPQQ